jgi:hypothetical protein
VSLCCYPCHTSNVLTGQSFKVLDRVVASIDDMAITESEFNRKYAQLLKIDKDIDRLQALNAIVNRELLLKDAQKYRIEGDEDEVMRQYIDLKFRALIMISDKDSEQYYNDHKDEFKGQAYEDVRNDIIKYLTEQQVNEKLKKQIEKLRRTAIIRIMLDEVE